MLSKLWCFLFGHTFWAKAHVRFTDEKDTFGRPISTYRWEKQKFCLVCEKDADGIQ